MSKVRQKSGWRIIRWTLLLVLFIGGITLSVGAKQEIPVLMYHFVSPQASVEDGQLIISERTLRQQLDWLRQWGYRVYSLDEYATFQSQAQKPPQRGVVLTFDDGNRDFYEIVYPILQAYEVSAASFLVWDNLVNGKMGSMTINQARELLESPWVTLGVHTIHHKTMINLSQAELEEETFEAKRLLENALPVNMKYFCYPSGHFDQAALEQVKRAGFTLAFTTTFKRLGGRPASPYSIPRIKITEKDSQPMRFWLKISGYYSVIEKIRWKLTSFLRG